MKFHRDREISKFDSKIGGKWYHRVFWTDVCVYRWGLLWPCIDFLHRFAVGFAVGIIQWAEKIEIHNFLITFAIELCFVLIMVKLEPFRDRIYFILKLIIHSINITACGLSIGYVSSTDIDSINDIGTTVVWLFFTAWILALIGVFYLGVVLPVMIRCGVKCVQSQQIRERSELEEEVAKKQEKLEQLVLGNIASADLVVDMRSVELGVRIGAGGSGIVHKATLSGMPVVVKSLISNMMADELDEFLREAAMLAKLRHPNVCMFYGIGVKSDTLYLVQEYCDGGSLRDFRKFSGYDHRKHTSKFMLQLFKTLHYLHSRAIPVIHRDIKPDNLLIHGGSVLKVGDLGTSREQGMFERGV